MKLNLLSLASVKAFAEEFMSKYNELHVLLNNAGVMMCPYGLSEDGIETQFATHHVAHYYLTILLLPLLEKSKPCRIVTACNLLFTRELAKRLEARGIDNLYVNAAHPGIVRSDLLRHTFESGNLIKKFVQDVVSVSTEDGALTQLYLATSPEVESKGIKGKYYVPFGKAGCPNPYSSSDNNAARLWDFTENLLKEKVPGYPGAPI
ncbi:hypothetical protein BJV82DRAFT_506533 [Fennellomyces sp. T-0311]|nr:hypothetical protein BJV82DRAFT_506533 [Fennellomyces sp. T-0311]